MTAAFLSVSSVSTVQAQSRRPSTEIGPVTVGGSVGVFTEAYRSTGINDRRPAGTGRIFGNTSATASGVRYSLDFLLSTEDDRIRQSQNRFAFSAAYKGWTGTLGDFSPTYNKFGLNGTTIRGGQVQYAPGNLLLSLMAGQSQREVNTALGAVIRRPAFRRSMFAARVGYGDPHANHAFLTGFLARDQTSSLTNSTAISPAENVHLTPQFGLQFLDNRLILEGELTASAFSGDTRTARFEDSSYPTFFGLFTPRIGSRFDYATSLSARYTHIDFPESMSKTLDQISVRTTYDRVDPGFVSLGRPYTRSDQAVFRFQPRAQLLDRRLMVHLDVVSRRNNLGNTRNATLKRNQISLATQAQLSPKLFASVSYLWLDNNNEPTVDNPANVFLNQRFVTQSLVVAPVFTTQIQGLTHRFSLTTSYQSLSDKTARPSEGSTASIAFDNTAFSLAHAVILSSGLALNNSLSLISSNSSSSDVNAFGLRSGVNYAFFDRKLTAGLLAGFSTTTLEFTPFSLDEAESLTEREQSTQWTFTINSTYRVSNRDVVRFVLRGLTTNQPVSGNFSEIQSSLRYEHRF